MLKIDRTGFLALALGMNLGACATSTPSSSTMGTQQTMPGPTGEAAYAPSREGMAPAQECTGYAPTGECNQWAPRHEGGMAPAQECVAWAPTGECNQWEPRRER